MLTGAELYGLNDQFVRQAGLGQALGLTSNQAGTSETAIGPGASTTPAVVLSLSATAKASLARMTAGATGDEIALTLFGGKIPAPLQQQTPITVSTKSDLAVAGVVDQSDTLATDVTEAKQMSAADRFYAMTDESQAEFMATTLPPDQQANFLASFKAKTLTIQDASDVPGLNYSQTTTAIGSATGRGESVTESYNSTLPGQLYPGGSLLFGTPVLGSSLVTWPSSSTSGDGASNSSTAASNAMPA